MNSFYEVLGVARTATLSEIKKAYRKLAKQYHPDTGGSQTDIDRFKEITSAFEIIGDPIKRSLYDMNGYVGPRPTSKPKKKEPPKPQWEWPQPEPKEVDLNSIKCEFFGGGGSGRNILTHLKVTKEELLTGGKKVVRIKKRDICGKCIGDGYFADVCAKCNGTGKAILAYGYMSDMSHHDMSPPCYACQGTGDKSTPCSACHGDGVFRWIANDVTITIPPNSSVGQQILVVGEGESSPRKAPGYLRVVLIT